MLLPLLLNETREDQPFVLLQSTVAQSILPFLRALCRRPSTHTIVYCFLYVPSSFSDTGTPEVEVRDWSGDIPGYNNPRDISIELSAAIKDGESRHTIITTPLNQRSAPKDRPLNIIIDSLETLSENLNSPSKTYVLLREILRLLKIHPGLFDLCSQIDQTLLMPRRKFAVDCTFYETQ
jgi:elongator complex protein 5